MDGEVDMGAALNELDDAFGGEFEDKNVLEKDAAGTPLVKEADDGLSKLTAPEPKDPAAPAPTEPKPEGDKPADAPAPASTPAVDALPKTWKPELADAWTKADPALKAEVLRREEDMFQGIAQYKADAQLGTGLKQVLAPYEPLFKQYNIDPMQQVSSLMQAHHTLATASPEDKGKLLGKIIADYKIDPDLVPLPGEELAPKSTDPTVTRLQQEVEALKSTTTAREAAEQAERQRQADVEIDKFFSDPANVYAKDLASDIASLIRSGVAKNLAEAYEKAVWTNPVTRQKEVTRQATEAQAKAKADADKKAADARAASAANVKAKARSGSPTAALGSMDETLEAAFKEISSRG